MFLVVGSNGQLGSELQKILGAKAEYVDRQELDITDQSAVEHFFHHRSFDAIVNCAAYTAVDKAEDHQEEARILNEKGPSFLAETGIPVIQISTDYVFDGQNWRPYVETDAANPLSVYGRTKLAGEKAVLEKASAAVVIRTAWLYSPYGNNFVRSIRRLAAERKSLNVVFDQVGTPTCAADLAAAIVEILPQLTSGLKGIWHFSNEGVCSWYDFAREIVARSALTCEICPIESAQYPTPAKRPFFSVLNKKKIKDDFNLKINHWQESLTECLKNPSW